MYGTDKNTGEYLTGLDHLRQSVADIITTPLNSRVMIRGYGCGLFDKIDAPMNGEFQAKAVESIHIALTRWEPRVSVGKVEVIGHASGQLTINLTGFITQTQHPFTQTLVVRRE